MHRIVPPTLAPVIRAIRDAGGTPYIVGGAVRDALLGMDVTTKDLDFEIYHLPLDTLLSLLRRFGKVDVVGRSFGVIKLWTRAEGEIDFSLPRRESKSGSGHRGFIAEPDPEMSPQEACARRDFTLNAVLMNPSDGALLDYFDGRGDLERRVLRHTSEHFPEDPLRPLRAVQLAARFDFAVHPETAALCAEMAKEASTLPSERIFGEWQKWALRAASPSAGLRTLREIGWLGVFPTLARCGEDETRFQRLLRRTDTAGASAAKKNLSPDDSSVLLFSALCRETAEKDVDTLLAELGIPARLSKRIRPLVSEAGRLDPAHEPSDAEILHAATRLDKECFEMLAQLMAADPVPEAASFAESLRARAERLGVRCGPPAPLLQGRDMAALGIAPGPEMGRLLRAAFEAQLSGEFHSKEGAAAWIAERALKNA